MTGILRSTTRGSRCPVVGILAMVFIGLIIFYNYKVCDVKRLSSHIKVTYNPY